MQFVELCNLQDALLSLEIAHVQFANSWAKPIPNPSLNPNPNPNPSQIAQCNLQIARLQEMHAP